MNNTVNKTANYEHNAIKDSQPAEVFNNLRHIAMKTKSRSTKRDAEYMMRCNFS